MLRCPRLIEKLSRARVAAQKPQILSKQAREGELGVAAQKPQNVKTLINSPTQSDASRLKDTSYILHLKPNNSTDHIQATNCHCWFVNILGMWNRSVV